MIKEPGVLFIVSTPIGNLEDLSSRACSTLKTVDYIAAEDTRHSKKLLTHFNIQTPLKSYHDASSSKTTAYFIEQLENGKQIALISDAGTPLISDPGYELVRLAHQHNIPVRSIPGPCAVIAALSISGLPADEFLFIGFLNHKPIKKKAKLEQLSTYTATWVAYESPHRIVETLCLLESIMGPTHIMALVREITKCFETVITGSIADVRLRLKEDPNQQKGEFVLIVQGKPEKPQNQLDLESIRILNLLCTELPLSRASALTAKITGLNKKVIYEHGRLHKQNS
ncbi:MAG: 16S rRNA (cytidine(1402)-2'-O)-methyltransferase [Endozoicomonadaceae bacterium]|nr:16S rRNA (cytidine(1402)-2'-O)-methyltransferase [Endozoicomonadaceae bacterium]MBE8233395.1 16S rRNA (cytidine(1402)-2'-O)-methyltransferase [Endozoicomonadaceae bacterium]